MSIGNSLTLHLNKKYDNGDIVVVEHEIYQIVKLKNKTNEYIEYTVVEIDD